MFAIFFSNELIKRVFVVHSNKKNAFVFKRSLSICYVTQGHFQQVPVDLGFHFQNCEYFLGYFTFFLLTIIYMNKAILRIFVYLFICKVTTIKVNFCFQKQCSQTVTRLICESAIFAQNAIIVFQLYYSTCIQ